MLEHRPASPTDNAFCIGCGYPLRRLESDRCPECGRAFEPADARTMSAGRPLRRWQRCLLEPIGWPTIALALLGTAGLLYLGGWPRLSPEPWPVLRDEFRWPSRDLRPFTAPDIVFHTAIAFWVAFWALVLLRRLALLLVPCGARRGNASDRSIRRRKRVVALAAIVSVSSLIFGWQHRIGRRWIARVPAFSMSVASSSRLRFDPWCEPPVRLSPERASVLFGDAIAHLASSEARMRYLGVFVQHNGKNAFPGLMRMAALETDAALLAWELRIIGLCRRPESASMLIGRLRDPRPQVRAAAADAVGILRHPGYSVRVPLESWNFHGIDEEIALNSVPPVNVSRIVSTEPAKSPFGGFESHDLFDDPSINVDPSVRPILQGMMIDGATVEEREAAARTLVDWPPDVFHFRVAEWGVWINNSGHMALAQSVLDEIPPFVHRTGNPISSFGLYFLYPYLVSKPIVHLTSDLPIAADLEVRIRSGRPWFGFPMPDDFGIGNERDHRNDPCLGLVLGPAKLLSIPAPAGSDDFDNPAIAALPDCREGYPWLVPHHRLYWSRDAGEGEPPMIYNLGLRWQSLIVCPEKRGWMAAPVVADDPRFRWWARLREVPSSWVVSRGEAERFLYYDGPTRLTVPIEAVMAVSGDLLRFATTPVDMGVPYPPEDPKVHFEPLIAKSAANLPAREGLYIDVRSGIIRGQHMTVDERVRVPLNSDLPLHGGAVIQRLRSMLTSYGLTAPEAEGLIATWTPQFFQTEGRRFLLRMSAADYDWQCPMQVRPTPTEVVRLGLVLTEFDAAGGLPGRK